MAEGFPKPEGNATQGGGLFGFPKPEGNAAHCGGPTETPISAVAGLIRGTGHQPCRRFQSYVTKVSYWGHTFPPS